MRPLPAPTSPAVRPGPSSSNGASRATSLSRSNAPEERPRAVDAGYRQQQNQDPEEPERGKG